MAITLYDLCGGDRDVRFSPYCWRIKMALAHKGLDVTTVPTRFSDIAAIGDGFSPTVPVIDHDGKMVQESWDIACYLEENFADRPTLFGGPGGQAISRFVVGWADSVLTGAVATRMVGDIVAKLDAEDVAYFVESRVKRFGKPLADVQAGREDRAADFRNILAPIRQVLRSQPFIGGQSPLYADYVVFGTLQWPRVASAFQLLEADDPVAVWFERCLDLHDGLGRSMAASQ